VLVQPQKILTDDEWFRAIVEVVQRGRSMFKDVCGHTHFNHPNEVTPQVEQAMRRLHNEGVYVRNQAVLLRGVNDDARTLIELIRKLGRTFSCYARQPANSTLISFSFLPFFHSIRVWEFAFRFLPRAKPRHRRPRQFFLLGRARVARHFFRVTCPVMDAISLALQPASANRRVLNTAIGRDVINEIRRFELPVLHHAVSQRIAFAEAAAVGLAAMRLAIDACAVFATNLSMARSIALSALNCSPMAAHEKHQPDLFDKPKNAKLVRAIDEVNEKFGKGALIYGDAVPDQTSKIAFQRVPKVNEF
jgi:hypothetical protein